MTLRSMRIVVEHDCDENAQPDLDLCGDCGEHASFCSICDESNCCGASACDLDRAIDMACDRMKWGDSA